MNNPTKINTVAKNNEIIDVIQNLSAVYLTSFERLSALNLNRAREAVEEFAAAAKTPVQANASYNSQGSRTEIAEPMWQKTLAYSRNATEIIAETQEEMTKAMTGPLSGQPMSSFLTNSSSAMSELFIKGIEQFATVTSANMAAFDAARVKAGVSAVTAAKKAA